jgi:hypothetical protein
MDGGSGSHEPSTIMLNTNKEKFLENTNKHLWLERDFSAPHFFFATDYILSLLLQVRPIIDMIIISLKF